MIDLIPIIRQGAKDFARRVTENPHAAGSPSAAAWLFGWTEAQAEDHAAALDSQRSHDQRADEWRIWNE